MGLDAHLRIIWRPFRPAVKINIKLDLEAPNILFEAGNLFFDCQLLFRGDALNLIALMTLARLSGKLVLTDSQRVVSNGGGECVVDWCPCSQSRAWAVRLSTKFFP